MRKIITNNGIFEFIDLCNLHLTVLPDLSDVEVYGDFYCSVNNLINLTGAPHIVHGNFICVESNLTSLAGAPHIVGDSFFCHGNNLTSLKGIPKKIGGNFVISHTLQSIFSRDYIHSLSEISGSVKYM